MSFSFSTAGRIIFGAGTAAQLPDVITQYGQRVFVITGGHTNTDAPPLAGLSPDLAIWRSKGEPSVEGVRAAVAAAEATWQAVQETPRVRADSKQAQVIALLQRPQGTSIAEIMALTGWQAHSIRGLFAGTLKKRGIAVTSEKAEGGERVYRATLLSEATA